MGFWFTAAVLFAFLTAGVMVYRAADPDIRTAANVAAPLTAQSNPLISGMAR